MTLISLNLSYFFMIRLIIIITIIIVIIIIIIGAWVVAIFALGTG